MRRLLIALAFILLVPALAGCQDCIAGCDQFAPGGNCIRACVP